MRYAEPQPLVRKYGSVYLVSSDTRAYKIGWSGELESRLYEIKHFARKHELGRVEYVHTFEATYTRVWECFLHALFLEEQSETLKGEWFNLSAFNFRLFMSLNDIGDELPSNVNFWHSRGVIRPDVFALADKWERHYAEQRQQWKELDERKAAFERQKQTRGDE